MSAIKERVEGTGYRVHGEYKGLKGLSTMPFCNPCNIVSAF
jgi:hypothetical protein